MLGSWHASVVQGSLNWTLTLNNGSNGAYQYKAQAVDSGTCSYDNQQWRTTSAVTGQFDMGTYRVIDARNVEFSGLKGSAVCKRR
jgi:hypothetical protein